MIIRECVWYECVHVCVGGGARLTEDDSVILPPYPVRQGLSAKASAHQCSWSGQADRSVTLPLPLLGLQLQVICCTLLPFIYVLRT